MKHTQPNVGIVSAVGLFLALVLCAPVSAAQLSVGFRGGVNLSNMNGDRSPETNAVVGISFGGFLTWHLAPALSLQSELAYVTRGVTLLPPDDDGFAPTEEITLSYVDIPLLVKLSVPGRAQINPFIVGGPVLSLNLGATDDQQFAGFLAQEVDVRNVRSPEISALVGAGAHIPVEGFDFVVDVRYSFSLRKVFEDVSEEISPPGQTAVVEPGTTVGRDLRHRGILVTVGFNFDL
jgi:hypothetical protein